MAFFEELFPECVKAQLNGGPRFLTTKGMTVGGQRYVNQDDPYPLQDYIMSVPLQESGNFEAVRAFVYVIGGDRDGFRVKDWGDYLATQQNTSLTLISGSTYQLNRLYVFGARTFVRPIRKPVSGLQVFRTRSAVVTDITGSSTISTTAGTVVVSGHMGGDTYTWSGEFHVPVALKDPMALFNVINAGPVLAEWANIQMEEVRT